MGFRVDEIVSVLEREISRARAGLDAREVGRVLEVGDGIARVYGLSSVMAGEMVEFTAHRRAAAWRSTSKKTPSASSSSATTSKSPRATRSARTGAAAAGARRRGADRPRRRSARQPARRQGRRSSPTHFRPSNRSPPAWPAGSRSNVPLQTGIKAIDAMTPDRPRPARADHRRPQDGQDRHRHRHHHQPERQERHLRLRRHRPEGIDGRPRRRDLREAGAMDYTIVVVASVVRPRAAAVHRPLRRLRDGRVLHVRAGQGHARASTTT